MSAIYIHLKHDFYDRVEIKRMSIFEREMFLFLLLRAMNKGSQIGIGRVTASAISHELIRIESQWIGYNEEFLKEHQVILAEKDFRKGSATSVHNLLLKLQRDDFVTYDDENELYLINRYSDYCQMGTGSKVNFARHIIKQYEDKRSLKIWQRFVLQNKFYLEELNNKIKDDFANPSNDFITLDKVISLEGFHENYFEKSEQLNLLV